MRPHPGREESIVEVQLLGDVAVRHGHRDVNQAALGRRSAAVVLARLALADGVPVARDDLARAVWGATPPSTWQASLRNVIASLRAAFDGAGLDGTALLGVHGAGYVLALPAGSSVDALEVTAAGEAARPPAAARDPAVVRRVAEVALERMARPFLAAFGGPWPEAQRARLDGIADDVRRAAAEAALADGDPLGAEMHARALVVRAPLREDGHRLLIRALHAAGNAGAALEAYDACRRTLREELGTLPSPETEALLRDLLDAGAGTLPPFAGSLLLLREGPFVGRDAERDRLAALLRDARGGRQRVLLVTGEPGIGKTRLAAEAASLARAAGMPVLYGRADDRLAIPHRVLLEAIASHFAAVDPTEAARQLEPHTAVLGRLLPALQIDPASSPAGFGELDRLQLAVALEHALRVAAGDTGALLVLDDLQWASAGTLALISELGAGVEPAPLFVLALRRDSDHRAVWDGWPDGAHADAVTLDPLTVDEVAQLAGGEGDLAAHVWRRSGGNPLFASELLRPADNAVRPQADRLAELVRVRVATLPRAAQAVLETAAVAGLEFDPAVVVTATDLDKPAAGEGIRAAQREGLLAPAVGRADWLAFRHALVRDSLLESLPESVRLRLHQRLGAVLESRGTADRADAVDLAYHFTAAAPLGTWERAVRYAVPVARAAADAGAYEDTVEVCERTLAVLHDAGDPAPSARLDVETLLGEAQHHLGDSGGHALLRRVLHEADERGDPVRQADAALAFNRGGAASDEAFVDGMLVDTYEASLDVLPAKQVRRRAELLGHLATGLAWSQSGARGLQAVDEALELVRELGDDAALARVLTTKRRLLSGLSLASEQERVEDEMLAIADEVDDPGHLVRTLLWRFATRMIQGRGAELAALLDRAAEEPVVARAARYRHTLAYHRAALTLLHGDPDEAEAQVEAAARLGLVHGIDTRIVGGIRIIQMISVRQEQGRLAEVRDEVARTFGEPPQGGAMGSTAFIDAELGRVEDLAPNLDAFFADWATGSTMAVGVGLATWVASATASAGDLQRSASLYADLQPFAGLGGHIANLTAPVDHALGLLAAALGHHDAAVRHHDDAIGFAQRLGAPRWVARAKAAREAVPTQRPDGGTLAH